MQFDDKRQCDQLVQQTLNKLDRNENFVLIDYGLKLTFARIFTGDTKLLMSDTLLTECSYCDRPLQLPISCLGEVNNCLSCSSPLRILSDDNYDRTDFFDDYTVDNVVAYLNSK